MNRKKKIFYYYNNSTPEEPDTTSDGEQVFAIIGDSNADGRGETIPTVDAGILYKWNGATFDEITNQTVANTGSNGSSWQQFSTDYNSDTDKKILLVNSAKGGSTFYPEGALEEHWMGSGAPTGVDLYEPFKTSLNAALAAKGLLKPKAIIIGGLGINDITAGTSAANIESGIDALITNLTTDYPEVPILYCITGRNNSASHNAALYHIRRYMVGKAESNENLYIVGTAASLIDTGMYNADNLHFTQAGYNALGSMYARWFKNSAYTNKWARSIISSHFDELSTARKGLINTFISNQYSNGNYLKLEYLSLFKTSTQNNIFFDWTFFGFNLIDGAGTTFTANQHVATAGSANYITYSFIPTVNNSRASQTDFIEGVKLKTNTTGAGVLAILFGASDGSDLHYVRQSTTVTGFTANDATATTGSEASLASGNLYCTARTGTTKRLIKNKTVDAQATVTSTGATAGFPRIGAFNSNGTIQNYIAGEYEYAFAAKYSDFNLDSFFDDIETLIANW